MNPQTKFLSGGKLRDREERFRTTVDQAPVGISHADMHGRWIYVNQRFCDIVGYTREELLNKSFTEITHPDFLPVDLEPYRQLFAGDISSFSHEKQYIRKDGESVWVNVTVSLVRDHDGKPSYTIGIIEDINEKKQRTEALRNAEMLLAVGRLAATVAHELNNPIAGMFNLVYLLQSDPSIGGRSRQLLDALDEQLKRVADVSRRALTFYRETTTPEPVQLCSLFHEVLGAFADQMKRASITVRMHCETEGTIIGYPGELRHMIANILTNSMDALEDTPGERHIRIAVQHSVDWRNPGRKGLRIFIGDTGSGIPKASWPTLFDPFFTTKPGANGLGLWVAKGIIEKHGGSIRFRSSTAPAKHGTCFSIFLPRSRGGAVTSDDLAVQIGRELLNGNSEILR